MSDFDPIKIPFELPTAEILQEASRMQGGFADIDKSVQKAENRFNSWVKSQLQGVKSTDGNVAVTQKYSSVLATLERRMAKTQDPKIVQAYANAIGKLKAEVNALGNKANAVQPMRKQFDGLGNSINMITRDLPAFTYSAQTGFMAISNNIPMLADEIGRLTARNKELLASGQKTKPVWKQVVSSLLTWQTALSMGIMLLTVYGKEIGNWVKGLFDGSSAAKEITSEIEAMNSALKDSAYKKAVKDVLELKTVMNSYRSGVSSSKEVMDTYNETLSSVVGELKNVAEVEQWLTDKSSEYVKMVYAKAVANASLQKGLDDVLDLQEGQVEREGEILRARKKLSDTKKEYDSAEEESEISKLGEKLARYSKEVAILELEKERIDKVIAKRIERRQKIAERAISQYKDFEKSLGLQGGTYKVGSEEFWTMMRDTSKKALDELVANNKIGSDKYLQELKRFQNAERRLAAFNYSSKNDAGSFVNNRKSLLKKLAALDTDYAQKSYAKDEQELQALRMKFDTVREEIAKFNANPKNKVKIDTVQLDKLRQKAESDLLYRQGTEGLKKQLAEQKQLFENYENYKTKLGKEKADERYRDSIGTIENYKKKLSDEIAKLQTDNDLTGVEKERLQILLKAQKEYNEDQQQLYDEQLADLITYEEKRKVLVEQFNEQYASLMANGDKGAAKVLQARHKKALDELDDEQAQRMQSYKALFNGLVKLSKKELKVVLANAKKMLETEKLSAELRAKIQAQIKELENLLNQKDLNDISAYVKLVGQLGESFSELGKSVGNSRLADAGSLLSGLAMNIDNVLVAFDKSASKADRIAAGVNGVIQVIDTIASASAQRRKAEEEYYYAVLDLQHQYNLSLNEQIRLQSELSENVFLKDYVGRVKDGLKSLHDASKKYDESLQKLIKKGQARNGLRKKVDWGNVGKAAAGGAAAGAAIGSIVPVIGTAIGAAIGGIVGAIGGFFGGKKKVPKYVHILKEYPELIQKSETGQLKVNRALAEQLKKNKLVNKETEKILENLLAWDDAIKKSREQIKSVIRELAGSLSQNLRKNLVDAFKSGEDAAKAMGKTVDDVLENILSSLIFNKIFNQAFEDLEKEMAASQDIGGDGSWVDDLSRFFEASKGLTEEYNKAMEQAQEEAKSQGFDVFKKKDKARDNSLKGAVRGMTEKQADLLAGQFGGLRLTQLDTNRILRSSHLVQMKRLSESIRVAKQIEINTRKTAENTKGMREGLKSVETAVKQRSNTLKANGI